MTSPTYLKRLREIAEERGLRSGISPAGLLERWEALVDEAEDGYGSMIDEYKNERAARDVLDVLFTDPVLRNEPEVKELQHRVADVDDRMRALFRDDVHVGDEAEPWWRRGVLRFAGEDYADSMRSLSGIDVASRN